MLVPLWTGKMTVQPAHADTCDLGIAICTTFIERAWFLSITLTKKGAVLTRRRRKRLVHQPLTLRHVALGRTDVLIASINCVER
jgi:hypothetical protein